MRNTRTRIDEDHTSLDYEIRLKGHLDARWADWFGGLTITLEERRRRRS